MFVMRYGNYTICLMCMLLTHNNLHHKGAFYKKMIFAASPLTWVMVIGSNFTIDEFDADSDLYFIIYFFANSAWVVFAFGYLWVFNEQNS